MTIMVLMHRKASYSFYPYLLTANR